MENLIQEDIVLDPSENISEEQPSIEKSEVNQENISEDSLNTEESTQENTEEVVEIQSIKDDATPTEVVDQLSEVFSTDEDRDKFADFLSSGDLKDLPEELITEKFGQEGLIKIQAAIPKAKQELENRQKDILSTIHTQVCPAEEWNKIKSFANDELGQDKLDIYREQLSKGGKSALIAAEALQALYRSSSKTHVTEGKALQGDRRMAPTNLNRKPDGYIDQMEYSQAMKKALTAPNASTLVEDLGARRLQSMEFESRK